MKMKYKLYMISCGGEARVLWFGGLSLAQVLQRFLHDYSPEQDEEELKIEEIKEKHPLSKWLVTIDIEHGSGKRSHGKVAVWDLFTGEAQRQMDKWPTTVQTAFCICVPKELV